MDTSHWELSSDASRDIGMIINMERGAREYCMIISQAMYKIAWLF